MRSAAGVAKAAVSPNASGFPTMSAIAMILAFIAAMFLLNLAEFGRFD